MKKTMYSIKMILKDLRFVDSINSGTIYLLFLEGLMEGITPFISIYASAQIINGIEHNLPLRLLLFYAFLAVGSTLVASGIKALLRQFKRVRWQEMLYKLDLKVSLKMSQVDYSSLENPDTYQSLRSLREVENLESGFKRIENVFQPTIKGLSSMIISVAIAYKAFIISDVSISGLMGVICSPWSAIVVIGCMICSVVVNIWASKGVLRATRTYLNKSRAFTNQLLYYTSDYVNGYTAGKDIRLYGQKKLISQELSNLVRKKSKDNDHCENQSIGYQGIGIAFSGLLNLIVYLYVAIKALAGLLSVGDIVKYVGGIMQFTTGLTTFLHGYTQLKANTQFMDVYYHFFELPNAFHAGSEPVPLNRTLDIEFKDVSFCYPGTDNYVLNHFNCKLDSGKHYAIVGMNGSGKTTMVKLLCRLYDPQNGCILLGGKDIREYDYDQYLALFSVVFQDSQLFPLSLGQNVSAEETYDDSRVRAALKQAGFGPRFATMQNGSETVLFKDFDAKGIEISSGEAQKIALARAFYKDAPMLVLDEPTASLDPVAEQEVYLKFHNLSTNKTAIYISHRLSSCKFCDEILVINHGQLVQRGGHDDLLRQMDGLYYEMWHAQAQYYQKHLT